MANFIIRAATGAINAAKPQLKTFLYYGKVELAPPKPTEIPAIISEFGKLLSGLKKGNWKNVTVKQAIVNTAITTEVLCWFFIGECIGKRNLVGYDLS